MSNVQTAMAENTVLFAEQSVQSLDGLYTKAAEFILTPDDTFKRKLDLIEQAKDMSTPQKIDAMNQAEDNAERLAMILGVSRTTAYELMHSDAFPTFRIGSRICVKKDHLLAWIDKEAGIAPEKVQ